MRALHRGKLHTALGNAHFMRNHGLTRLHTFTYTRVLRNICAIKSANRCERTRRSLAAVAVVASMDDVPGSFRQGVANKADLFARGWKRIFQARTPRGFATVVAWAKQTLSYLFIKKSRCGTRVNRTEATKTAPKLERNISLSPKIDNLTQPEKRTRR